MHSSARTYANRLNAIPVALFSLWSGGLLSFWLAAFGLLRSFGRHQAGEAPFLWLLASMIAGLTVLLLPASWFRLRRFEASGRVYEALGVRAARAMVGNGDVVNRLVRRRHPGYRVHASTGRLEAVFKAGMSNERTHLALFAVGVAASLYAWRIGWTGWLASLAIANLAADLYRALVQRYTRSRLLRIARRPSK